MDEPITPDLRIRRRNLPHWQVGGSCYYITVRSYAVLTDECRRFMVDHVLHWDKQIYEVAFGVVMPDHFHVMLTPLQKSPGEWYPLSVVLHKLKSFSANRINSMLHRRGTLWQEERYDRIMRGNEEFQQKWDYMLDNPVRAGLVSRPEEYEFYITVPENRGW